MIRLQDMTPDVYYQQSRDFQFIGRLFDIVLNATKTNVDLVKECPISDNSDKKLMDLMTLTLGFKSKHNYNIKQLAALCSAFCEIIKNKGSVYSLELAIKTLFGAEGIDLRFEYEINQSTMTVSIYVPKSLSDVNLLKDLLNYILPAGMRCRLILTKVIRPTQDATSRYGSFDDVKPAIVKNRTGIVIGVPQDQQDYTEKTTTYDNQTKIKESIYGGLGIAKLEPDDTNNNGGE